MGVEKEVYRENLELLNLRFPDHDLLSMDEVLAATGYKSKNTILKHLGDKFVNKRISKVYLALYMCG